MEIGELTFIGFCSLAAINALFFAVYIAYRREKNMYSAVLLSAFMVMTAFRIFQMLLHDLQEDFDIGIKLQSFFFFIPVFPLVGPFLYLYISSVSEKSFRFREKHLLHLLPFILVMIFELLNREKLLQTNPDRRFYIAYSIEISFILVQFLVYVFLSFFSYIRKISDAVPDPLPRRNENWLFLRNIIVAISVLWFIYALYCVQIFLRSYLYAIVAESLYYSVLSYIILFVELKSRKITILNNPASRYRSSGLSADDLASYKSLILEYVSANEIYKDHNITLGKLAKSVSLTPHIVSQVINDQLSYNFNDFINSYRIEAAKRMLKDPGMINFTVASIAYDCGFNTLSAFNTSFKKFTGITPSLFRSKVQ